jgi:hypothetical protein
MQRPQPDEYNSFYERYISLVPSGDVVATLTAQWTKTAGLLAGVPEEKGSHRYEPGKWSVKEMIGHMIDTERIMSYRAMRIARGDATPLAGFEQDDYVRNANFDGEKLAGLVDEFAAVRRSTTLLFKHMHTDACTRRGVANNNPISVRALAWIIAGHELHHRAVLEQKYLAA